MNYSFANILTFLLLNLSLAIDQSDDYTKYSFYENTNFCNLLLRNSKIERIIDLEADVYFKIATYYHPFHKLLDQFGTEKTANQIIPSYDCKL